LNIFIELIIIFISFGVLCLHDVLNNIFGKAHDNYKYLNKFYKEEVDITELNPISFSVKLVEYLISTLQIKKDTQKEDAPLSDIEIKILYYIKKNSDLFLKLVFSLMIFILVLGIVLNFNLLSLVFSEICFFVAYIIFSSISILPPSPRYKITLKNNIQGIDNPFFGYVYFDNLKDYVTFVIEIKESETGHLLVIHKDNVLSYEKFL
jgi:hypothetical protein